MIEGNNVVSHVYKVVKVNKCDMQYIITHDLPKVSFLTERIKIEAFQGYSNATNLCEYLRLRGATSWKSGKQVSGLWKTIRKDVFYGDDKTNGIKALIIFHFEDDRSRLTVHTYPHGNYPNRAKIDELINAL